MSQEEKFIDALMDLEKSISSEYQIDITFFGDTDEDDSDMVFTGKIMPNKGSEDVSCETKLDILYHLIYEYNATISPNNPLVFKLRFSNLIKNK